MRTLNINLPDKNYAIIIEKNMLQNIHKYIEKYIHGKKSVVITDENVYDVYGKAFINHLKKYDFDVHSIVIPPGEQSKSLETLEHVYSQLINLGITKSDRLIALGGGVIGDLSGFAAATFLRGVPFIQIPTSLIAQVDSSIGGKTAVNLALGKNLVGSFYHPEIVLIDPAVLTTLKPRYLWDGMAEVIKYGCIKNSELFSLLENIEIEDIHDHMEEIIYQCCAIKKEIVEKDEKDENTRMLLNFGHTIGHGIEKLYGYSEYTHGEGVAIGMHHITQKSESLGLTGKENTVKIKSLLNKYHLPSQLPDIDKSTLIKTLLNDKKSRGSKINLILLNHIGDSFIHTIDKASIGEFI
ncbi:MAG: 3-dehydroquinate synthase [Clostridia bacterium]|nr:3-dehydroquinate synthase [Clostridia bacterium]